MSKLRMQTLTEEKLGSWKLLERFIRVLDQYGESIAPKPRESHGLRELDRRTYFGRFLFGLFNPVVASMRGLCGATKIKRVAEMLGRQGPVAISGFSDAQHVFSPELIHIFGSTVWKAVTRIAMGRLAPPTLPAASRTPSH